MKVEKRLGKIIPDIVLYKNGTPLILEVAVTNKVNEEKKKKIKGLDISTIEIKLNKSLLINAFDKDKLEQDIIFNTKGKSWVYNKIVENKKLAILKNNQLLIKERKRIAKIQKKLEEEDRMKKLEIEKN